MSHLSFDRKSKYSRPIQQCHASRVRTGSSRASKNVGVSTGNQNPATIDSLSPRQGSSRYHGAAPEHALLSASVDAIIVTICLNQEHSGFVGRRWTLKTRQTFLQISVIPVILDGVCMVLETAAEYDRTD